MNKTLFCLYKYLNVHFFNVQHGKETNKARYEFKNVKNNPAN